MLNPETTELLKLAADIESLRARAMELSGDDCDVAFIAAQSLRAAYDVVLNHVGPILLAEALDALDKMSTPVCDRCKRPVCLSDTAETVGPLRARRYVHADSHSRYCGGPRSNVATVNGRYSERVAGETEGDDR